jgi:predicted metal-dependent enzyme (double-stranded beta helix superfamily)
MTPLDSLTHPSDVARALADRRYLWAPHVRFDPAAAHRAVVWTDGSWEAELTAFLPGQRSAAHPHVGHAGAVLVLQGRMRETTWLVATDGPTPGRRHGVARVLHADDVRSHGPVHVHDLGNDGPDPAVALHVRAVA